MGWWGRWGGGGGGGAGGDSSVVGEGLPNWSQKFMPEDLTTLGQTDLCSWIYSLDSRSSRFKTSQHWDRLHYILSYTYLKAEILTWRVQSAERGVGGGGCYIYLEAEVHLWRVHRQTALSSEAYSFEGRGSYFKSSQHWDRLHYIQGYIYLKLKAKVLAWRVHRVGRIMLEVYSPEGKSLCLKSPQNWDIFALYFGGILTWRQRFMLEKFIELG